MVQKMSSKTEIFNIACTYLGITPDVNNAESDDTEKAITMRGVYENARKFVLRDHHWSCCRIRGSLSLLGTSNQNWAYQYAYPANCLRALEIEKYDRRDKPIPFVVEQYDDEGAIKKVILTDQPQARLIYTKNETNEGMYDEQLANAIGAYLAFRTAGVLTTDKDAGQKAYNLYLSMKYQAQASDGNEGVPDEQRDADWIAVRG